MLFRRTAIAAILLASASAGAGAIEPLRTLKPGFLRIGTYFVNPPFEFVAENAHVGFEVDLIEDIARRLRLKPAFVNTTWEKILKEMQRGRYDCIVGGITITPEREQKLAWSVPYMMTTLSLAVNGAKTPEIRSLANLKDAIVGVQAATTDYDAAVTMWKRGEIRSIKVYPFAQIEAAVADLEAGRITAVMKVAPVASWLAEKRRDLRIVAQVPDDPQPLGIGFRKHEPALVAAVNGTIAEMFQDGSIQRLKSKWGIP